MRKVGLHPALHIRRQGTCPHEMHVIANLHPGLRGLQEHVESLPQVGKADVQHHPVGDTQAQFPADPAAEEALYAIANALYERGDVVPARQTADELIAAKARSPWAAAASMPSAKRTG